MNYFAIQRAVILKCALLMVSTGAYGQAVTSPEIGRAHV